MSALPLNRNSGVEPGYPIGPQATADETAIADGVHSTARRRRLLLWAARAATLVLVIGGWQLLTSMKIVDPFFWGRPSGIVRQLNDWVRHGTAYGSIWLQIWITMKEALLGFFYGVIAGVLVGVMSELLVGSISETAKDIGLSEFFIGVIVIAIVGNAAEHWVAVLVAAKDKMDLAVNIAIGSSAQIALFVAPVLVLLSFVIGPNPMPLVFNGFELGAIVLAVIIANQVTNEGESTWYEGLQLLAVYLVLALAFFFATR